MRVVKTLGDGDAVAMMPSIEKSGTSRVPHPLPGRVDILVARAVKHSRDAVAHGNFRLDAHCRSLPTSGGKSAVQDAPFGHMNFNRAEPAVAPGYVPKKEVGHDDGNLSDGSGQGGIGAVGHLGAGSRKVQKQILSFFSHGTGDLILFDLSLAPVPRGAEDPRKPLAVGKFAQTRPSEPLGVRDHFASGLPDEIEAELFDELDVTLGADVIGSDL